MTKTQMGFLIFVTIIQNKIDRLIIKRNMKKVDVSITCFFLIFAFTTFMPTFAEQVIKIIKVPETPQDIVVNESTGKVYTAIPDSNKIIIIDSRKNKVIGSISLGGIPASFLSIHLAVNPVTNKIYAASAFGGTKTISVIDGTRDVVEATIDLDDDPADITVDPKTNRIYVIQSNSSATEGEIKVIDGSTNNILSSISLNIGADKIAFNPNTFTLYVSGLFSNEFVVVDSQTNTVISTIEVGEKESGKSIEGIAINEAQNKIYVSYNNTVQVIDGLTDSIVSTITLHTTPTQLAFNEKLSKLYVLDPFIDVVTTIDAQTNNIIETTHAGITNGIAVNSSLNSLYVNGGNTVSVIKTETQDVIGFTSGDGEALDSLTSDLVSAIIRIQAAFVSVQELPSNVRSFRTPVLRTLKKMEKVLASSKVTCGKRIIPAVSELKALLLSVKKINNTFFVEDFALDEDLNDIKSAAKADDIMDGIPDVCGN